MAGREWIKWRFVEFLEFRNAIFLANSLLGTTAQKLMSIALVTNVEDEFVLR